MSELIPAPESPQGGRPLTALTRSIDPPAADPVGTYTAILLAAQRLSAHYDSANPAWDHVIAGYVRAIN